MNRNKAICANIIILKSKAFQKSTKIKIYKNLIRHIFMYAAETMSMSKKQEVELRVVKRKAMRLIMGSVEVNEYEYRRRTNLKIQQRIREDVVKKIKQQRMKWLRHARDK